MTRRDLEHQTEPIELESAVTSTDALCSDLHMVVPARPPTRGADEFPVIALQRITRLVGDPDIGRLGRAEVHDVRAADSEPPDQGKSPAITRDRQQDAHDVGR